MVPLSELAVPARQLAVRVGRSRAKDGICRQKRIARAALPLAEASRAAAAMRHSLLYLVADEGAENGAPGAAAAENAAEDTAYRYPPEPHGDALQPKNAL